MAKKEVEKIEVEGEAGGKLVKVILILYTIYCYLKKFLVYI